MCADSPAPRRPLLLSKRCLQAGAAAAAGPTDPVAGSWHEQLTLGHLWNLLGRGIEQGRCCPGISQGLRHPLVAGPDPSGQWCGRIRRNVPTPAAMGRAGSAWQCSEESYVQSDPPCRPWGEKCRSAQPQHHPAQALGWVLQGWLPWGRAAAQVVIR